MVEIGCSIWRLQEDCGVLPEPASSPGSGLRAYCSTASLLRILMVRPQKVTREALQNPGIQMDCLRLSGEGSFGAPESGVVKAGLGGF